MKHVIILAPLILLLTAGVAVAELQTATFTATPNLVIPDSPAGAVTVDLEVDLDHYISDIRIYLDLTTPDGLANELTVTVVSAWATELRVLWTLHGGEPDTSPVGWYPTDFTPKDAFDPWIGEGGGGTWSFVCRDMTDGGGDSMLNEFRVEIQYDDVVATDQSTWSQVKALYR